MRVRYIPLFMLAFRSLTVRSALVKSIHTEPKFCYNCIHCLPDKSGSLSNDQQIEYAKCGAFPKLIHDDSYLVTGKSKNPRTEYPYCSLTRQYGGKCGPDGSMYVSMYAEEESNQEPKIETTDSKTKSFPTKRLLRRKANKATKKTNE